jgi:hypothetical protein
MKTMLKEKTHTTTVMRVPEEHVAKRLAQGWKFCAKKVWKDACGANRRIAAVIMHPQAGK